MEAIAQGELQSWIKAEKDIFIDKEWIKISECCYQIGITKGYISSLEEMRIYFLKHEDWF